jgi:folate-dependent phosphoribosylglycinamide formyltransferase PurN
VGVFGPFGVVPRARGQGIAEVLLAFALFSLRERGYDEAIVPMVRGRGLRAFYERKAHARIVECIAVPQGERRWKTTVLASGNGSNFQAVLNAVADLSNPLGLEVAALVCNRPGALALERAAKADVRALLVPWDRAEPRAIYDATLLEHVAATQPDLILLLGWMHVLAPEFVERFPDALNIHPAFLPLDGTSEQVTMPDGAVIPAFRGARAVDELFAAGVEWGGATVHRVGVAVDRGEVLARAPLRREPGETKAEYLERLHELEHRVLISAVRRWCYERAVGVAVPC